MDCGDAGHILLSKRVADDLGEYEHWRPLLHDLGECEVKHGMRVSIVSLYADEVGNPQLPKKFQAQKEHRARMRWATTMASLFAVAAVVAGIAVFSRNRGRSTLSAPEKSVAVLPFENRSEDKANAYFADGIQDDSDALIEDRRPEGDLAHFHPALQKRAGKPAGDCQATWRSPYRGRKCAEERRRRARERAADKSSR